MVWRIKSRIGIETLKQGCALRKITRSPKVPNYEIQGAQHKAYMKEIRLSGRQKAKVCCLRHLGALRAQPCEEKEAFLNANKIIVAMLLTDGISLKPLIVIQF